MSAVLSDMCTMTKTRTNLLYPLLNGFKAVDKGMLQIIVLMDHSSHVLLLSCMLHLNIIQVRAGVDLIGVLKYLQTHFGGITSQLLAKIRLGHVKHIPIV